MLVGKPICAVTSLLISSRRDPSSCKAHSSISTRSDSPLGRHMPWSKALRAARTAASTVLGAGLRHVSDELFGRGAYDTDSCLRGECAPLAYEELLTRNPAAAFFAGSPCAE